MKKAPGSPAPSHCLTALVALFGVHPCVANVRIVGGAGRTLLSCLLSPSLMRDCQLGDIRREWAHCNGGNDGTAFGLTRTVVGRPWWRFRERRPETGACVGRGGGHPAGGGSLEPRGTSRRLAGLGKTTHFEGANWTEAALNRRCRRVESLGMGPWWPGLPGFCGPMGRWSLPRLSAVTTLHATHRASRIDCHA